MIPSHIDDIVSKAIVILQNYQLSERTIEEYKERAFSLILKSFDENNEQQYSQVLIDKILLENEEKFIRHEISTATRNWIKRGCKIIEEIYHTGNYVKKVFRSAFDMPPFPDENIYRFAETRTCNERTTKDQCNIIFKLYLHLKSHGTSVECAEFKDLQSFLVEMKLSRPKSMDDVIRAIKAYYGFLNNTGIETTKAWTLLGMARARERKAKQPFNLSEIAIIISSISLDSANCKRDIAILLLAATTGLRACDIATLKLQELHLRDLEIRLIQDKTNEVVNLPLQEITRNAIADYLINERPRASNDNTYVFLSSVAPYGPFKDGVSVAAILRRRMKEAGIEHSRNDGRTFHGIRRSVGTNMIANGVPITTVSQVLGHKEVRSTKPYIALDLEGLKKCTLSFLSLKEDHNGN